MQFFLRLTALCCLTLACLPRGFAQSPTPPPADEHNEKAWKVFSSPEGGFKILLPGIPAKESRSVETRVGWIGLEVFELKTAVASYLVTYSDFPRTPDDPQQALKQARERAVEQAKGKVLQEKKVKLGSYPGLELIVETPSTIIKSTFYAVKQRLYQIVILLPTDQRLTIVKFQDTVAAKFLSSFKLTPADHKAAAVSSSASASAASKQNAPSKPEPKVVRLSERALKQSAIKQEEPIYTQEARDALASGAVQVAITISEAGRVIEAKAISGNPLLYEVSVQTAKQWVFKPLELSGVPVQVVGVLTFTFIQE